VPIDREKVLQAAQKYVEKKRYDGAIAEYQKLIQDDPNDARTLLKIGDLQARLQAYPEAIATYDRVGQHYATQGFSLKAVAVYKQIREIIKKHAPDLADRYAHIGPRLAEIYTQLGLTSDALAAWDEVASRLQRASKDRDAADVFRRMVELDRGNPLPHLRLGEAYCRLQSLDEAVACFWLAADLLLNLGRQDDALKVIERILHFRSDARYARVAAELYLARNTREDGLQALAKLQICFQNDPKDLDTLGLLGQAFTLIGQEDKAVEVYKEMARVAREQGRADVYDGLLEHLRTVAPDDDQVALLLSQGAYESAPPEQELDIALEDSELEVVDVLEEAPPHTHAAALHPAGVRVAEASAEPTLDRGASGFDAQNHLRKAIADAESFRKLRLYHKAIETLHIALELDPSSIEVRSKLRDLLVEAGDRTGALAEAVNVAALYLDRNDLAAAEPLLRQVLEADPRNEGAIALYEQVAPGYAAYAGNGSAARGSLPASAAPEADDGYDPNAPLPSYDLEEVSADQALSHEPSSRLPLPQATYASERMDEPFSSELEGPLPSFPFASAISEATRERVLPSFEELDEISQVEEVSAEALEQHESPSLEDVLEEADFFVARGLLEDARTMLQEQLGRMPNNRLVLERLREVEEQLLTRGASQTIERSQIGAHDSKMDISGSLDALDSMELPPGSPGLRAEALAQGGGEAPVNKPIASFKAGIRAQVSEGDSATHYDLGVAYKEMGLISDALHELSLAARDPQRECMCFAMIGLIHLEQDQLDLAAEAYVSALAAPVKSVEQEMNLYYDLGNVYEMKGLPKDALYHFQKIARRDPGYRDVRDRIDTLVPPQSNPSREPSGTRAVNDDDEFERVFDDLFESK
jgi:tetratricopeptide (TPR) repeat protein